jgi:hypothetical protein
MRAEGIFEPEPFSFKRVIAWWEIRRMYYNALLLIVGVASVLAFELIMGKAIPTGEDAIEPMALILIVPLYAIMANLCYTLGWVVELTSGTNDRSAARNRARWMYRVGMWFSVALTTAPFWYACVFWALFHNHPR